MQLSLTHARRANLVVLRDISSRQRDSVVRDTGGKKINNNNKFFFFPLNEGLDKIGHRPYAGLYSYTAKLQRVCA